MDFKLAMEHVRDGTATEEERRLVEEEIEKHLLITEHLDAQWEKEVPPIPEAMPEMKQLHAKLRRHNILLILTCLLLVAAIAAAVVAYIAPRMEEKQQQQLQQQVQQEVAPQVQEQIQQQVAPEVQQQLEDRAKALEEANAKYWSPQDQTYPETYQTDLGLALECYSELRLTHYNIFSVRRSTQTDVGTYALTFTGYRWGNNSPEYLEGTLEKNVLTLPEIEPRYALFLSRLTDFEMSYAKTEFGIEESEHYFNLYSESLSELPEYIRITADIAFPEALSMEQLLEFKALLESLESDPVRPSYITWVGICSGAADVCGMKPFMRSTGEDPSEEYPYLRDPAMQDSAENLEQHFKSLLKFSQDQLNLGRGILRNENSKYYEMVLEYVEIYGVYSYGCKLVTTPQILLELMDRGIVSYVEVWDYWIGP